jgi:hypothetical protein
MSLGDRIKNYTGIALDDNIVTESLNASLTVVPRLFPINRLERLSKIIAVPSGGTAVPSGIVLSAIKGGMPARKVTYPMWGKINSTTSIYRATETDPAYLFHDGKVLVAPNGGEAQIVDEITAITTANSITKLHPDEEEAVVVYAAINGLSSLKITDVPEIEDIDIDLDTDFPDEPTNPFEGVNIVLTYEPVILEDPVVGEDVVSIVEELNTTIADFGTWPTLPSIPALNVSLTKVTERLADDDAVLAEQEVLKVKTELEHYQASNQKALADYDVLLNKHKVGIEKILTQAKLSHESLLSKATIVKEVAITNAIQKVSSEAKALETKAQVYQIQVQAYMALVEAIIRKAEGKIRIATANIEKAIALLRAATERTAVVQARTNELKEKFKLLLEEMQLR